MQSRFTLLTLAPLASLLLSAVGCLNPSDDTQDSLCIAGSEVFCRCPGGVPSGTKTCEPDGNSFGACRVQGGGDCPEDGDPAEGEEEPLCEAGKVLPCKCAEVDPITNELKKGTKACAEDQQGFTSCECIDGQPQGGGPDIGEGGFGASGAGTVDPVGGSGAGTTTGFNLKLGEPCFDNSDCADDLCDFGYCTKPCETDAECYSAGYMLCIPEFGASGQCAKPCTSTAFCEAYYQEPSSCGYALTADSANFGDDFALYYGYGVCADWIVLGEEIPLPPVGYDCQCPSETSCDQDQFCTLGNAEATLLCNTETDYCEAP